MRLLITLLLIGLSPWVAAKEFKMPCAEYEAISGEKVCDIAPMIPTSDEEIASIKANQKHQACLAEFKAQYPQCILDYDESRWDKRPLPDECYTEAGGKKIEALCPNPNPNTRPSEPVKPAKTTNVWG